MSDVADDVDAAADLVVEPQSGVLNATVHELPRPPARALSRALDALRPDPASVAEQRVMERLRPLHEMFVTKIETQADQLIDCERRLRALEAK